MIPLSVRMRGWMRYRDEQVADFTDGRLIAICGENGAGKSSIFDAITFALYGKHRLGKMHADQLISQDMDRLSVEFEFEAGGQRYLVRRSRGRKQGERDQSLWLWDEESDDWAPVPGTEKEDALDRAIAQVVRLSAEAFTSSFMLQQGAATEFIDADPKPRFDIISSLIGLKEYEELQARARETHRDDRKRLDDLKEKLKAFDGVDETTLARLRDQVEDASQQEARATAAIEAAKAMLADAKRHARLVAEIAQLDLAIAGAEELLAGKEQIEKDAQLFETLTSALDRVAQVQHALADAARAEAAAAQAQQQGAAIDVDALAAAHTSASDAVKAAAKQQQAAEKAHAAVGLAEREAYGFAQLAASVLEGRERLASFDGRLKEIDAQLKKLSTVRETLERDAVASKKASDQAEVALEAARKDGAAWRAQADQLKLDLAERKAAAKEATCARCGQRIDKAAAKRQIEELTARLGEAQAHAAEATAAEQAAAKARAVVRQSADAAAAAVAQHAQQHGRLDAAHDEAAASRAQAATALAEHEARLDGRLKDVATAQKVHTAAQASLAGAKAALEAARGQHDAARQREDAARAAVDGAKQRRAALESDAREQAAKVAGHRKLAESTAAGLGELGTDALEDPARLLGVLRANQKELADAPKRKAALDKAQQEHTATSAQRDAKQQEIDAIPPAHRVDPASADAAVTDADAAAKAARDQRDAATRELIELEHRIKDLDAMRADRERLELRAKRLRVLVKLLGKDGLQGALVTSALNDITSHANAFLQRLTGGSLQLSIQREGNDALELQATDATCMREPRSVKVLSGSQKFRCAVAIASGIGQYAGAGGMRSIVIDEGFASLDQASQQLMVEELKQLAEHMDKVIVVSHLEAFTNRDNFPDQILVEAVGTGSKITRTY